MKLDSEIFESEIAFENAFVDGLQKMLLSDELGAFILVLANACYEATLFERMKSALRERFAYWGERAEEDDFKQQFAVDDVKVFQSLQALGFDNITSSVFRMAGIWQLQFNALRSFRPARNAHQLVDSIESPFNDNGFHFNKPFLAKEIFWEGDMADRPARLLYNKFPFAPLHGLLVIDPQDNKPQFLTAKDHELIWQLAAEVGETLPIGIGYNATGAFASVNHQHFQTFVSRKKLPVELSCWQHNGGSMPYPLDCYRFITSEDAWRHIETLHASNRPYNLLFRTGELFCVSRNFQGSYEQASWTSGFAWSEVCGQISVADAASFHSLNEQQIEDEMTRLRRF